MKGVGGGLKGASQAHACMAKQLPPRTFNAVCCYFGDCCCCHPLLPSPPPAGAARTRPPDHSRLAALRTRYGELVALVGGREGGGGGGRRVRRWCRCVWLCVYQGGKAL